MTKIKINITRDVLQRSAYCGTASVKKGIKIKQLGDNCAFALAVRDLFSKAWVCESKIIPFFETIYPDEESFPISKEMTDFIKEFDVSTPEQRLQMKEQSFELEIPDWALEGIDISDVHKILEESKTMELVTIE